MKFCIRGRNLVVHRGEISKSVWWSILIGAASTQVKLMLTQITKWLLRECLSVISCFDELVIRCIQRHVNSGGPRKFFNSPRTTQIFCILLFTSQISMTNRQLPYYCFAVLLQISMLGIPQVQVLGPPLHVNDGANILTHQTVG